MQRGIRRVPLQLSARVGETRDEICGVQVLQSRTGYRFNIDPILLAHFSASFGIRGPAIDLGTGSGIIPLILGHKFGVKRLTALEIQPRLFSLAQRNIQVNRLERNITLVLGDVRQVAQQLPARSFQNVLCNPPYGAVRASRVSPDREKAIARHEVACSIADVAAAAQHLLDERGSLWVIYPASRLTVLFRHLQEHRLEPRRLRLVHPRARDAAKRVLVQAIKGAREELKIDPPLVLHVDVGSDHTREVESMFGR
jgi:tRNA1Val (adenine37-N6)-methyltransferase